MQTITKEKLTNSIVDDLETTGKKYRIWDTRVSGFYLQVSPKGAKTYYVRYTLPEKVSCQDYKLGRHGHLSPDSARKQAKIKLGEVARGVDIQGEKQSLRKKAEQEKNNTLGSFVANIYTAWALKNKKGGLKDLKRLKKVFGHWFLLQMSDITVRRVNEWRTDELERGLARSTLNREVGNLKSVLSKAVEFHILEASPLRDLKLLKVDKNKRVRYLSQDEECRLRVAIDEYEQGLREKRSRFNKWLIQRHRDSLPELDQVFADHVKPIVLMALNTGLRKGELFNLQWTHINWANNALFVEGDGSKSGQTRHVHLTEEARNTLRMWRKQILASESRYVFPSPVNGGRLDNIDSAWTTIRKSAGLHLPEEPDTHFRFHDLRHSFASNAVMAGIELNKVRELLGHSTIDMTLKYAHLSPESQASAIAILDKHMKAKRGADTALESTVG
ncbi:site-specific integrase [Endozoicomonas arenosclerae]|uniref:site-specific integrase n=1 Tax=Endozoicomonas arenosclerae TaxID=1633495 RepID=UPI0007815368|nr:site-specific integrase [Endozoicomonas arenosclerae]